MSIKKVYIVLLNYNGWRDTLECLESVLKLNYSNFRIVVVDNDSNNGSVERIQEWAAGSLAAVVQNPALASLSTPVLAKPILLSLLDADEIEQPTASESHPRQIMLIRSGTNGGYAAGNNHGIRLAMKDPDCAYLWLLNNDTVVEPDALSHLVGHIESNPAVGICGSTLVHYHSPSTIQARGGARFNRWTATSMHVGEGAAFPGSAATKAADASNMEVLDYVVGASMFVTRPFVERVGLMYEDYFLYFEEIDWAWRKGHFEVGYAPASVVYHKEGASTGMNKKRIEYGKGGDFYLHRNRLVFTRRNFPLALPVVAMRLGVVFLKSLQARRWGRARMILSPEFWIGKGKI
jgi:GT2 family glycosyltransferase